MKTILVAIISLFINIQISYSQTYSVKEYAAEDANLVANSIQKTSDGNFVVTTYKYCYTPNAIVFEGCFISRPVYKTNVFGDTIWTSNTSLWHNTLNGQMFENPDGSFSLLSTKSTNRLCDNIVAGGIFGFGRTAGYRVRLSTGEVLDEVVFNDECGLQLIDYTLTLDSMIFFLAEYDNFATGDKYTQLMKTDKNFDVLQVSILPSEGKDYNAIINTNQDEKFLIQTNYHSNTINLLSIDSVGNTLDSATIADYVSYKTIKSIKLTQNAELLIALGTIDHSNNQEKFLELLRVTLDGEIKWSKKYVGENDGVFIETINQEVLYATSYFNPGTNSKDLLLRIFNTDGDSIGYRTYDVNGNDDTPRMIVENKQNDLVILGTSNCCNKDTSIGPAKVFIIKDTAMILTNLTSPEKVNIDIYPNPFNDKVFIDWINSTPNAELHILDILGRSVHQSRHLTSQSTIDTRHWTPGIYFYQLSKNGRILETGKLLKS